MVRCDGYGRWAHGKCLKVTDFDNTADFICIRCLEYGTKGNECVCGDADCNTNHLEQEQAPRSSVKFIIDKEENAVRHEVQPGQNLEMDTSKKNMETMNRNVEIQDEVNMKPAIESDAKTG